MPDQQLLRATVSADFDPMRVKGFGAVEDNEDEVNLDGISDRAKYPGMRGSFTMKDKFSNFNHLVPGQPVPFGAMEAQAATMQ